MTTKTTSGSSGKRVPGVVEVVESELEVFHVTEPIGLPFHGLDFVVQAFQRAVGYLVGVVAEQPLHAGKYRRADRVELFDDRGQGIEAPVEEKGLSTVCCALTPKQAELFLHGMEGEQGLIRCQQIIEAPLFVIGQFMVIA